MDYNFFFSIFWVLIIICSIFQYLSGSILSLFQSSGDGIEFKSFQRNYLLIYYIVMTSDWLQGPYVYALYDSYGFSKSDIALLFIVGFLSSGVFGTFVGSVADKYGRKKLCLVFSIVYSLSCLTKLYNNFHILLVGRLLSGIATSLLFSSFESWMVHEHHVHSWSSSGLSQTFSIATLGNGIVAIVSGLVATYFADRYGYVSPFMVALFFLVVSFFLVAISWNENYGNSSMDTLDTFSSGIQDVKKDISIPLLGLVQSLFEASMYTFVFMWTPALSVEGEELPFGLIFACFMVCIMIGSSIFGILIKKFTADFLMRIVLFCSSVLLLVPFFVSNENRELILGSFLGFEICCGIYFPTIGVLRSKVIPEKSRSTIMNFFRIPLNFLVVIVLYHIKELQNETIFLICGVWLFVAFLLQSHLSTRLFLIAHDSQEEKDSELKEEY